MNLHLGACRAHRAIVIAEIVAVVCLLPTTGFAADVEGLLSYGSHEVENPYLEPATQTKRTAGYESGEMPAPEERIVDQASEVESR